MSRAEAMKSARGRGLSITSHQALTPDCFTDNDVFNTKIFISKLLSSSTGDLGQTVWHPQNAPDAFCMFLNYQLH